MKARVTEVSVCLLCMVVFCFVGCDSDDGDDVGFRRHDHGGPGAPGNADVGLEQIPPAGVAQDQGDHKPPPPAPAGETRRDRRQDLPGGKEPASDDHITQAIREAFLARQRERQREEEQAAGTPLRKPPVRGTEGVVVERHTPNRVNIYDRSGKKPIRVTKPPVRGTEGVVVERHTPNRVNIYDRSGKKPIRITKPPVRGTEGVTVERRTPRRVNIYDRSGKKPVRITKPPASGTRRVDSEGRLRRVHVPQIRDKAPVADPDDEKGK